MDLDEMKDKWGELSSRISRLETKGDPSQLINKKTAQERLVTRYRRMWIVAVVFGIGFLLPLSEILGMTLAVSYLLFLLVSGSMDFYLMTQVDKIDVYRMSVSEVSFRASQCRRKHRLFQLVLIPLCVVLLGLFVREIYGDMSMLYAIAIGVAVGIGFGLNIYFRFMDNYKQLIKNNFLIATMIMCGKFFIENEPYFVNFV